MKDCTVYKETSDNWCGSYHTMTLDGFGNCYNSHMTVRVVFGRTGPNPPINGHWRVGVWGNDDFGMIRDFSNVYEADALFIEVVSLPIITIESLEKMGFEVF